MRLEGEDQGESKAKVWPAKFDVALELVGRLMKRTADKPERWKTTGFPSEDELNELTRRSGLQQANVTS